MDLSTWRFLKIHSGNSLVFSLTFIGFVSASLLATTDSWAQKTKENIDVQSRKTRKKPTNTKKPATPASGSSEANSVEKPVSAPEMPQDPTNTEPRLITLHQTKPIVVVEGLLEAKPKDIVCFIKGNKKVGCGKVTKVSANKCLVKVKPKTIRRLAVGMEAMLKKSKRGAARKKKQREISAEKKNWRDGSVDYSIEVGAGGRYYPTPPLQKEQATGLGYGFIEPYVSYRTKDEKHIFNVRPFYRYDFVDDNRTLGDFRELEYIGIEDIFEWRLGIRKVFWGVTESVHLVDIINQTDFAGDIDGEDKLGQPMLNLGLLHDNITFDIYLISFFRERTFPGPKGRVRPPFKLLTRNATFEADDKKNHLDAALRFAIQLGGMDIGLSYFSGNGREPIYRRGIDQNNELVLIPRYLIIDQVGLEYQWAIGEFLIKLEAISNQNSEEDYSAGAAGVDYTRYGVFETAFDLTFFMEYLKDSRSSDAFLPLFQNDLFLGLRLNLNDAGLSSLQWGQYYDIEFGSIFSSLELTKRLEAVPIKVAVDIRGFANTNEEEPLHLLRRDSYINLELSYIF